MSYRVKPPTPDFTLKENRYDHKYIPPGGVNIISPMLSMKYNLSKEKIKKQYKFTSQLNQELLDNQEMEKNLQFKHFYCKGCNGLLFVERDLVYHVPANMEHLHPRKLQFMAADTSIQALHTEAAPSRQELISKIANARDLQNESINNREDTGSNA